jgi:hypothetical protein
MGYICDMAAEEYYPVKKLIQLTEEQAARISEFRHSRRISSENEAIRQLINLGLDNGAKPSSRGADRPSK